MINGDKLPAKERLIRMLIEIKGMTSITANVNTRRDNVILGEKILPVWGQTYITDQIGEVSYEISPLSFYQVNPLQTRKLYEKALEYAKLQGDEVVWDLYCGIGTISLFLAQKAKRVYGVEIVPDAVRDAKRNAKINGMKNVEFSWERQRKFCQRSARVKGYMRMSLWWTRPGKAATGPC